MTDKNLAAAVKEAKRFLKRAKALKAERAGGNYYGFTGTATSGSCRRASMDLTRALAALRRSA